MDEPKTLSRRAWLQKMAAGASALAIIPLMDRRTVAATAKVAKASVRYQTHPLDHKMCSMCVHFIPGSGGMGMMKDGTCHLVQGSIAPMGYCVLFAPKPS